jgi:hypothetical protein
MTNMPISAQARARATRNVASFGIEPNRNRKIVDGVLEASYLLVSCTPLQENGSERRIFQLTGDDRSAAGTDRVNAAALGAEHEVIVRRGGWNNKLQRKGKK